jgi:integrase
MRGSIIKRSEDSYRIAVSLGKDSSTGKYKQYFETVHGGRRDAEKRLGELIHELDTGSFVRPGKVTVAEFLTRWLSEYARANLGPRTVEGYQTIVTQHLIPKLGSIPLSQLRPEHLQKYYAELLSAGRCDSSGGLSAQTVRHHHTCLHKALATANEWGLLTRNVADAVKPPRAQSHEMQTWNTEDVTRFLDAARGSPYYVLFYTALFTGMRRSELLALRWQDVDFLFGQLSINRSLHQLRDRSFVFRQPKTARGKRTIALGPSAIRVLSEYHAKQSELHSQLGIPLSEQDLVFAKYDGKPVSPDTVSHAWQEMARNAGVKVIRLHDARHTHASLLLKQGIHPKIVQERLGHATISTTLDTYSHVTPGLQQAAARSFDEQFTTSYNDNTSEDKVSK